MSEAAGSQPSEKTLQLLKKYFGHSKFRPMQWEIISNALNNFDQLVVMATGKVCFLDFGMKTDLGF